MKAKHRLLENYYWILTSLLLILWHNVEWCVYKYIYIWMEREIIGMQKIRIPNTSWSILEERYWYPIRGVFESTTKGMLLSYLVSTYVHIYIVEGFSIFTQNSCFSLKSLPCVMLTFTNTHLHPI